MSLRRRSLEGQARPDLPVWFPLCPRDRLYSDAWPLKARVCSLAYHGAFLGYHFNRPGSYPGLLPGHHPFGADKATLWRPAASCQARQKGVFLLGDPPGTCAAQKTVFETVLSPKGENMANQSIITEFWEFLKVRKRYWLLPIIIVLGLFSALIIFTEGSAVAPFIYALF